MTTPIDYAPRDDRSWFRRHRRMLAIVAATVVLAFVARPAFVWAGRWVQWQLAWRSLAAEAARQPTDASLEAQLAAQAVKRTRARAAQPADAARRVGLVQTLKTLDRGLPGDMGFAMNDYADVRVFRMTRPDGTPRLVLMDRPYLVGRAFHGIAAAVCREPAWGDASFNRVVAALPVGLSMNGPGEEGVRCEMRLDDQVPSRLILRVGYRDHRGDAQRLTFEGRLTDTDRVRWRVTEATLGYDGWIQLRVDSVFEFEDAAGQAIAYDNYGSPSVPIDWMLPSYGPFAGDDGLPLDKPWWRR